MISILGKKQYLPTIIVAFLGLAATLAILLIVLDIRAQEIRADLIGQAGKYADRLEEKINQDIGIVQSLDAFITTTPVIDRRTFERFVAEAGDTINTLYALEWAPIVRADQRQSFVEKARREGLTGYDIREMDSENRLTPARERAFFVPVLYGQPLSNIWRALGYDLASDVTRANALARARDEDTKIATQRIDLAISRNKEPGLLVASPVYRGIDMKSQANQTASDLAGYAIGVFRIKDIVEKTLQGLPPLPLDLYIYDQEASRQDLRFLYHTPSSLHDFNKPAISADKEDLIRQQALYSHDISVAGRTWVVYMVAMNGALRAESGYVWSILAIGLTFTVGLSGYIADSVRRANRQNLSAAELERTNQNLQAEIAARIQIQDELEQKRHSLARRMREINCVYSLSKILINPALSQREICLKAVNLIASAGDHPAQTGARLVLEDIDVIDKAFHPGTSVVGCPILAEGRQIGYVKIHYNLKEGETLTDLNEAGDPSRLLEEIAERLSLYVERVRSQSRVLQAKNAAEQANEAKSRFFAAASHDLRQPLQAVNLYHHILKARLKNAKDLDILEHLGDAIQSADGLLDMLLQIAHLDAGVIKPSIGPVNLAMVLAKTGNDYLPQAQQKYLDLRIVPSSLYVSSDAVLLGRIVGNILSNAIRYTREGKILVGVRKRKDRVHIDVIDTGIGIPQDKLEDIFQEFYQLDNPERDRLRGLGLGLAIVKRMTELLGHSIEVQSSPGRGSCFRLTLPLASAPVISAISEETESRLEPLKNIHVMVVENERAQLLAMKILLEEWGCTVTAAESGDEAQAILGLKTMSSKPSIILSDFRLRDEETGLIAIAKIRQCLGEEVAGLIITGDTDPERLRQAKESGIHLLHKPVDAAHLRQMTTHISRKNAQKRLG